MEPAAAYCCPVPEGFKSAYDVRVRFAETDAQGIAHHASYVVWLEVARIAYLAEPRRRLQEDPRPEDRGAHDGRARRLSRRRRTSTTC